MAFGQRYIPRRIDLDSAESLVPADAARYIKNLIYSLDDTSVEGVGQGSQTGVYKPLPSNAVYVENFAYPAGNNHPIGSYTCKELNQAFWFTYNDKGNHSVHRINGFNQTIDAVYIGPALNFTLNPENFIHKGACWLEIVSISDPDTDEEIYRTFLFLTDGADDQHSICVEDSIATNGFDPVEFPFFAGDYDPKILITMATPTPNDCIQVVEVPLTQDSVQLSNDLLYNTWQFRVRTYDVWGRPSEYGIFSDTYIPGGGGCIQSSTNLARCLNLIFDAPPPHINQVEVAYRNCNVTQWYTAATINLYNGSPLGEWWLRSRNTGTIYPFFSYDSNTGKITYTFCAEQGCDPIAPAVTSRLFNPIPRTSEALTKINQFVSLSNNKDGFLPFSQDLLDQFTINIIPPDQTPNSARNIEIYVEIFNPFINQNEPIYQQALTGTNKVYAFGSFGFGIGNPTSGSFIPWKQWFINPNQSGFVGVLAGTGAYAVSQQYVMDNTGTFTQVTDFSTVKNTLVNPVRYFQKFSFTNVAPQTYIFRITDHQTDPTVTPGYINTSTYLRGSFKFDYPNQLNVVDHNTVVSDAKELIIDVCNGNYSTLADNKILVIYDLSQSTVRAGYAKNTNQTTVDQIGIELLKVGFTNPLQIDSRFTDHNGFFFVATQASGQGSSYSIFGYCKCQYVNFTGGIDTGSSKGLQVDNWFLNNNQVCLNYDDPVHGVCNFILITGKVVICGSDVGVPNIGVVLSRGGVSTTDTNGNFTIIAHDDATTTGPRQDNVYFITSSCAFTDCNDNCIPDQPITIFKCVSCVARTVTLPLTSAKYIFLKGLLSGGTYPLGVIPWDWAGRPGFVQPLGNAVMPSVYQSKVFAPSQVSISMSGSIKLPPSVAYLTFCIGQEITIAGYVDWIVDSFLFVDNTGLENTEAPTQIKIFYASLVEYNKQNNYNTTVNWGFLETLPPSTAPQAPTTTTQTPVTTDKVQFLLNGDGTFFTKNIVSLVKYDQTGQYFLIQYTSDLAGLVANARIRIFRPKVCITTAPYFETCSPVKVINGQPEIFNLTLNAFDTYYISRGLIPVPVAQDTNPVTYIDQPRLQGLPFEHNSPSDFWGQGCYNQGRANEVNPQETVIYSKDQIALSGALSPTAQLNFLCYFDEAQKFSFYDNPTNGIVSVIAYGVILLIIGQSDHYVVGYNDNVVRVDGQGNVIVPSAAEQFGNPQIKNTPKYGCLIFDKNTIYEKDGLVHWLDTVKSFVVQHNFSFAQQVSQQDLKRGIPGGIDSWLRPKIKEIQNFNLQNGNTRYWHSVVNTQGSEFILTDFTIGNTNPVNSEREVDFTSNETIAMSILSKAWKGFYGFTPELYIELEGELAAQQLFSFFKGIPYAHYNELESKGFGQMYGQNLVRVIEPVISIDNLRNKKTLAVAVFCKESQYFSDRTVSSTGQQTRMLLGAWIQASFGWYAPFLCDMNTLFDPNRPIATGPNVLMDGNTIIGTYVKVRLIGDPASDTQYSECQGIVISVFADVSLENK